MNAASYIIVQCRWDSCNILRDEQQLDATRGVESAVDAGLKRAGRLRQSVLKAAFEGRL